MGTESNNKMYMYIKLEKYKPEKTKRIASIRVGGGKTCLSVSNAMIKHHGQRYPKSIYFILQVSGHTDTDGIEPGTQVRKGSGSHRGMLLSLLWLI